VQPGYHSDATACRVRASLRTQASSKCLVAVSGPLYGCSDNPDVSGSFKCAPASGGGALV
jgi:hypothetical protein